MPARSLAQQRAMGAALAVKRGQAKTDSATINRLAQSMSETDLRDFAARIETPEERSKRYLVKAAQQRTRR